MGIFKRSSAMTSKDKLNMELALKVICDKFNESPGPKMGILFDKDQKDTIWLTEEDRDPMALPRKMVAVQWLDSNRAKDGKVGWALAFSLELLPAEVCYVSVDLAQSKYVGKDILAGSTYFLDAREMGILVGSDAFTIYAAKLTGLVKSQVTKMNVMNGYEPTETWEDYGDEPKADPTPTSKKIKKEDMN